MRELISGCWKIHFCLSLGCYAHPPSLPHTCQIPAVNSSALTSRNFNAHVHVISSTQTWQKACLKLGVHSDVTEQNFRAMQLDASDNLDFNSLLSKEEAGGNKHFFLSSRR